MQRIYDSWTGWPSWAKWTSGIGLVVVAQAAVSAAGERDFVTGFIQSIAAIVLNYGVPIAGIALAVWAGMRVSKASGRQWAGWTVGIVIAVVIFAFGNDLVRSIPGVGPRIAAMQDDACRTDWDGRANPMVCD